MTQSPIDGVAGALGRLLVRIDRFLASPMLALVCFMVLGWKAVQQAGWQTDEFVLVMLLYINFSTRFEQIETALKARAHSRKDM